MAAAAIALANSSTVGSEPACSRRDSIIPRVHSVQQFWGDGAFDHIAAHDDERNAQFFELGRSCTQCLFAGVFAGGHRLVRTVRDFFVEVSHVAGHEHDAALPREINGSDWPTTFNWAYR